MPQLRAARFDRIGHPDARLGGLLLDFCADGRPAHSVIWLRNGGGKSSILSILFTTLSPALKDFVGGKGAQRRALSDVVLREETSHVAAEWGLEDGRRLVTGCVLERQPKRGELGGEELRRWWYAFRSDVLGGPTLADLPVRDAQRGLRRNAAAYLDALDEANRRAPACELIHTDNQRRWLDVLIRYGLDPELFRYQLEMNRREGGAEELFAHVSTSADLVDLILRLAMGGEDAVQITKNLERYAGELRNKPRYELEAAFLSTAIAQLEPLAAAAEQLVDARDALEDRQREATQLHGELDGAAVALQARADATAAAAEALKPTERELDQKGDRLLAASREAQVIAATRRVASRAAGLETARQAAATAEREHIAWEACIELAYLRAAEAEAAVAQQEIDRTAEAARPVLEELRSTASELAGMLLALRDSAAERARKAGERKDAAETHHKARTGKATEAASAKARLEEQVTRLLKLRQGLEAERASLVTEGLLGEGEDPPAAERRVSELLSDLERSIEAADYQRGEIDAAALLAREEAGRQSLEAAAAAQKRAELQQQLQELESEAERLASDPHAAAASGGQAPVPVWTLREQLSVLLRQQARRANRALVDLEVQSADDRRAIESLRSDGLLPPRPDVEIVLEALHRAEIPAVAGWRYLAMQVQVEHRPTIARKQPALADGVVVIDPARFDRARRELTLAPPSVASPVLVGLAAGFQSTDGDGAERFVVAAPDSLFDESAAGQEFQRTQQRLEGYEEQRRRLEEERQASEQLAHAADALLARCPPGHLEEIARQIESLREQELLAQQAAADAEAQAKRLLRERQELDKQLTRDRTDQTRWLQAQPRVQRLVKDLAALAVEPTPDELRRGIREAERAKEEALAAAAQAQKAWQAAEADRQTAEGQSVALNRELATVLADVEERRVRELRPRDPQHVTETRALHRTVRERYLGLISNETLRERKRQADLRAVEQRRKLATPRLAEVRARAEELAALPGGADPDRADLARQQAGETATATRDEAVRAEERLRTAEQALKELEPDGVRRGMLEAEAIAVPEGIEATESLAERLAVDANAAYSQRVEVRKRIDGLTEDAQADRTTARDLRVQVQRLVDRIPSLATTTPGAVTEELRWDSERAAQAVDAALRRLASAEEDASQAHDRCRQAIRKLSKAIETERFDTIQGRLRERLRDDEDSLVAHAGGYAAEARVRLRNLEEHLVSLTRHQEQLVEQLCGLVNDAAALLRRAETASRLPGDLGDWSHQPFLRLRFSFPRPNEGLRDRMREVIADLVAGGPTPTGQALLERAVHAAAGRAGFAARLLKPSAVMERREVAVEEASTASGGERLTAALLLFFLLVRLRAPRFGLLQPTYTLFADNPIGTCSSVSLLQLQRRVADSFNVQLIYATGVNDLDALSVLPKIIRLRNEHVDARTRHQYVTLDEPEAYRRVVGTEVYHRAEQS